MGWLKLGARSKGTRSSSLLEHDLKVTVEHVECVSISPAQTKPYPFADPSTPDAELPFISKDKVSSHRSAETGGLYIVIDNVVFDCTGFISKHPGGDQIIRSFAGAECSWQFWRFHGKKYMLEFGRSLRVGRTKGMVNKFPEPVRWVGLRRLGDEWD